MFLKCRPYYDNSLLLNMQEYFRDNYLNLMKELSGRGYWVFPLSVLPLSFMIIKTLYLSGALPSKIRKVASKGCPQEFLPSCKCPSLLPGSLFPPPESRLDLWLALINLYNHYQCEFCSKSEILLHRWALSLWVSSRVGDRNDTKSWNATARGKTLGKFVTCDTVMYLPCVN